MISLFERRLIIVSGKGGVGKTSVSAALALLSARQGLKTLLCEIEQGGRLAKLFDVPEGQGKTPLPLRTDNLYYLFIDPESALEEYMAIYVRFKALYSPIINSPMMNYFLKAAPGFKELLTIGKIWWEEQLIEKRPKRHRWDLLIVDAPATGHGISFMGVSQATMRMVRVGPIRAQAQRMVEALQDPRRTCLVIPEEMPVNETKLLADKSRNELGIHLGPIIVNAVPEEVIPHDLMAEYAQMKKILESSENLSPDILSTLKLVELGIKRRELALTHINKLKALLPNETFLEIPFLPDWNWDRNTIDKIAEILQQKLS
jgi:anion-transporting  ArsA/GET3 family ATPase